MEVKTEAVKKESKKEFENLLEEDLYKEIINKKYHTVLNHDSTKLYIDPISEMYLIGTTIDYIHEDYKNKIFESKFQFIINKI